METKNKMNNTIEDNNAVLPNNVTTEDNKQRGGVVEEGVVTPDKKEKIESSQFDNVAEAAKVAGKAVKGTAKAVGAVAGGAVKSAGVLANIVSFFASNFKLILILSAIGCLGGISAYIVKEPTIEDTANVVEEVKKISEFTTACYYEESVIKNEKITTKAQWFGNELDTVKNSVVLTVMCKVRAGFDLSELSGNDLVVRGDTVDIKLPAPKIFDVISNPSDYRIFEETGKWQHEEIVAMQKEGKERMLQNALDHKILEKANTIGKERIETLFATFGFNVVNVTLTDVVQPANK